MSKKTLMQLVNELRGESATYGWDALTLYDQHTANVLLFQLYINRLDHDDYIEPITTVMEWGGGDYQEHLYDVRLSAPWLSFEASDPEQPARARLTMDMLSGMIVSTKSHSGGARFVSKMLQILPVGGPQLWMDQPLTQGRVNEQGEVLIDLNNADNFEANFEVGDLDAHQVAQRFKEYFQKELTPEQKRFPLGRLSAESNGLLTPKNFVIRTMASEPTAVRGNANYGDGAVMMFITLKDGTDSSQFPNKNSPYLIPSDEEGTRFTGAMLLSSKILAKKILKPAIEHSLGSGLVLEASPSEQIATTLKAVAGEGDKTFGVTHLYWAEGGVIPRATTTKVAPAPYQFKEAGGAGTGFNVNYATGGKLNIEWSGTMSGQCKVPGDSPQFTFGYRCTYELAATFTAAIEQDSGHVALLGPDFVRSVATVVFQGNGGLYWNDNGEANVRDYLASAVPYVLERLLTKIEIPAIDTFLVRNLLFSGQNALQPSEAFVPGDLAVFGKVAPSRTTLLVSPANSTVEANSGLELTATPLPEDLEWTARDVDGGVDLTEQICPGGYFRAPSPEQLPAGVLNVIVTARGTLGGNAVEGSAQISVLRSAIVTNPLYDSCDAGKSKELFAQSLNGGVLEWEILTPQWGSRLEPISGEPNKQLYIAGGKTNPDMPFSLDKIQVTQRVNGAVTLAYFHILIYDFVSEIPVLIAESSNPQSGTVQFELQGKNGPVPADKVIWKLHGGDGVLNAQTGEYTEPLSPAPGSFIVVSGTLVGDDFDFHGVAAVPLPLIKYAELIKVPEGHMSGV